jgi:Flp pilus assembly CpaE family ATPase
MLSVCLISNDKLRCQSINNTVLRTGKMLVLQMLEDYPAASVLVRLLNSAQPEIALIDLDDFQAALVCAQKIRSCLPNCAIFGFQVTGAPLPTLIHSTLFQTVLPFPLEPEELLEVVEGHMLRARVKIEPNLTAFIPGKAGSGASTLAWNAAARLGRDRKVLLMEGDMYSGTLSYLLNITPQGSLQQFLRKPEEFGSFLLRHYITQLGKVDALLSDRTEVLPPPDWETYFRLIDAMVLRYNHVILDLPERPDAAQMQLLRRAGKVFLVTTPDLVAVRLAARAVANLRGGRIADEHISVLLNRHDKNDLSPAQVEDFLGVPVGMALPNDSWSLGPTVGTGQLLQRETNLGRAIGKLSAAIMGVAPPAEPAEKVPFTFRSLLGTR